MNEKNMYEEGVDQSLVLGAGEGEAIEMTDSGELVADGLNFENEAGVPIDASEQGEIPNFDAIKYEPVAPTVVLGAPTFAGLEAGEESGEAEVTLAEDGSHLENEGGVTEGILGEEDIPVFEEVPENNDGEAVDVVFRNLALVHDALPEDILSGETIGASDDPEQQKMLIECEEIGEFRAGILENSESDKATRVANIHNLGTLLAAEPRELRESLTGAHDRMQKWLKSLTKNGGEKIRAAALAGVAAIGAVQAGEAEATHSHSQGERAYVQQQEGKARAEALRRDRQIQALRAARERQRAAERRKEEAQERALLNRTVARAQKAFVDIPMQQAQQEQAWENKGMMKEQLAEAASRYQRAKGELDRWLREISAQLRREGRADEIIDAKEQHRLRLMELNDDYKSDQRNIQKLFQRSGSELRSRNEVDGMLADFAKHQIRGWITGR